MSYAAIMLILPLACIAAFFVLSVVDHFQGPSREEFNSWAAPNKLDKPL